MSRSDRTRNEPTLKPIGFALAAVVAGLGTAKADPATMLGPEAAPAPDQPTASSGIIASFAPDDVLLLDMPVDAHGNDVPLGEKPAAAAGQRDLFDAAVPLGRT